LPVGRKRSQCRKGQQLLHIRDRLVRISRCCGDGAIAPLVETRGRVESSYVHDNPVIGLSVTRTTVSTAARAATSLTPALLRAAHAPKYKWMPAHFDSYCRKLTARDACEKGQMARRLLCNLVHYYIDQSRPLLWCYHWPRPQPENLHANGNDKPLKVLVAEVVVFDPHGMLRPKTGYRSHSIARRSVTTRSR
jgi:hypothetical protein